jgi:hypothetical protein
MFHVKWRSVAIERNLRGAGVRWRARRSRDGGQTGGVRKTQSAEFRDRLASRAPVARQVSLCAFCDLALVCTWAISGLAAVGAAVWFGFDIGTALGAAG